LDANWVPDIVGRAYGNRGNARSRQGKLLDAIRDYNMAIELCPWSVDPLLNRGAVLEQLGRFVVLATTAILIIVLDVRQLDSQ
jgi:tetratricopeptide (TPR) repeat protein